MTTEPAAPSAEDMALRNLAAGIEWARILGLDTAAAEAVLAEPSAHEDRTAAARAALSDLAGAAGIQGPVRDLVTERWRRRATDASVSELAALLDMDGLEAGAIAVTRARALRQGAGPTRPLTAVRNPRSRLDPAPIAPGEHLRTWRDRGGLGPVSALVFGAVERSLPAMPPALRPGYAATCDVADLEGRLAAALDRLIAREEPEIAEAPNSPLWRTFGLLQWLNLLLLVVAVAWTAAWVLNVVTAPTQQLPVLGRVPVPALILALAAVAGILLAAGLRMHADRLGRRWARRLEVVARIGARQVVEGQAFRRVDTLESARLRLAGVARDT